MYGDSVPKSPIPPAERLRVHDLDFDGLAFWGVVSGAMTLHDVQMLRAGNHSKNMARSILSRRLTKVINDLAARGILNPATPQPLFDADHRCRNCGVVHAKHPQLLAGGKCFRYLWGGPPPLNTAGLRPGRKR